MKSKDLQPRVLYPAKLSFKLKGEIRSFPDKKKLKEFVNTKPVLQQMVKSLKEEAGREEEKHQCGLPLVPFTRDLACNPGMCPDWESNQ